MAPADFKTEPAPGRKYKPGFLEVQERRAALFFLTPAVLLFMIFVALPVVASLLISLSSWDLFTTPRFVGLENYIRLVQDPIFHKVLLNTFWFVLGTVALQMVLGLALALVLNQRIPGQGFFRVLYFLPVVSPPVAVALVWSWIFNENFGLLNSLLFSLGVQDLPRWLASTQWALPALMIVSIWQNIGYAMVLFLAGLQNIPPEIYEAGALDGAIGWKRLRYLTLPLLSPTTFFVLTISIIFSFQVFDLAFVMTDGGPSNATNTVVFYIYQNAFRFYRMGYASAAAWILFIIILVVTLAQYRVQNRWVHYE
ncbi:MAG: sugar ABC transporter permease [Meiothermus silvanus]|nr:sugar ABC transporter permease [Allomeiothermus silvanus]